MATNRLTPGREGYKILFNDNMVIMNYKFAAAAAKYGTKENKLRLFLLPPRWNDRESYLG